MGTFPIEKVLESELLTYVLGGLVLATFLFFLIRVYLDQRKNKKHREIDVMMKELGDKAIEEMAESHPDNPSNYLAKTQEALKSLGGFFKSLGKK